MSALGRQPTLPHDACARAHAAVVRDAAVDGHATRVDTARYVCARVAIVANDGTTAKTELDAMQDPRHFFDIELVLAQTAKLTGDRAGAKAHARLAARVSERDRGTTEADVDAIVALARQLAR